MKKLFPLLAFGVLCLVSAPAFAGGSACFSWSCDQSTATCTVNASCSTASPYIYKYTVDWGDGTTTGLSGSSTHSHTYASGVYGADVTVSIIFFSDPGSDAVTCPVFPRIFPVGPQPPSGGQCP